MSSIGANKKLMLAALREVGSKEYLIEFVRFRTQNELYDKGFIASRLISTYVKDTVDSAVSQVQYLKAEFEAVKDTFIPYKSIRYFKDLKKELLNPISITKQSALAILAEHNKNVLSSMNEKVSAAEEIFFEHPERNYKHLEKFIRVTKPYYFGGINFPEKTVEVINKNFYEVGIEPNLLDATYIDDFIGMLDVLKEHLKNELWDEIDLCFKYIPHSESGNSFSEIISLEEGSNMVPTAQKHIPQHHQMALSQNQAKSPKDKVSVTFEDYLNTEGRQILPFLKEHFGSKQKRFWAYMVIALSDLGMINKSVSAIGHSQLHSAIELTFRHDIGSRQNFSKTLNNLDKATAKEEAILNNIRKLVISKLNK